MHSQYDGPTDVSFFRSPSFKHKYMSKLSAFRPMGPDSHDMLATSDFHPRLVGSESDSNVPAADTTHPIVEQKVGGTNQNFNPSARKFVTWIDF